MHGVTSSFNPTVVRLRQRTLSILHELTVAFNPTVVRLRLVTLSPYLYKVSLSIPLWCDCDGMVSPSPFPSLSRFQSHCGAIATCRYDEISGVFAPLSIPLWCDCDLPQPVNMVLSLHPFNPTVVRLRQEFLGLYYECLDLFQSHCGAIATK